MAREDQVAVGIDFNDVLEMTLPRGWCVQEMVEKIALEKLKKRNPKVDYDNLQVTVHSICCEDNDIEVVFNLGPKGA